MAARSGISFGGTRGKEPNTARRRSTHGLDRHSAPRERHDLPRALAGVIATVHNLGERGIAFRSLTEGFDTTTAGGEFLFHIMAALAQMERRMIVERTHAGLEAARRQGRHGGRPTVMTPERTELARTLREQGKSLDAIASTLGVGRSSVSRALTTEVRQKVK
ncbi:recombinase family protein [Rhodococcus erythropolis]|nr:recombinase family protein [Rhodococcus erythropolis]